MPTMKPRITVTFEEPQYRVLARLAALQGVSMSSIVVDLVETVVPVLDRVSNVLEAAKTASESVTKKLRKSAENAESVLSPIADQLLGQLDHMQSVAVGGGAGRSPAPAPMSPKELKKRLERLGPHPTNRGVRIPPSPKVSKSKAAPKHKAAKGKT